MICECRGGIRDGSERNTAKPCNAGDSGFSTIAESGTKTPLTTWLTTDRKIFQSRKFCAIMVQNQISGYSAVGSALDLGSRGRAFESLYSDQNPSEINDFRGIFLFFVYCGAESEKSNCKHGLCEV